ncbi:se59 [Alphabaculovirus alterspexiguae]|uniref:Se59 n=1 Tax=Spodoptera exigua multiple nucleopolyhedrovirus TaxID=10454 RepID=A0A3G2JU01_9ABAC|nr:se59 [Spodoptera exigua multiple nucleopolyhedrovirus]AYN45019.1 se59 [Spodoptera exigua multiple nucleopolyhedrovirus]
MYFKTVILILIIFIIILIFNSRKIIIEKEKDGYCKNKRFMPNLFYNNVFYDCKLRKFGKCPNECNVFNYKKQKCEKGIKTTTICNYRGILGNIPDFLTDESFYWCWAGNVVQQFTCSPGLCFDVDQLSCVQVQDCNNYMFECENNCEIECA